jgi:hypothetical protein
MKIDQEEEDSRKTASNFYDKYGAAPSWCAQDLKINILKTSSSGLPN